MTQDDSAHICQRCGKPATICAPDYGGGQLPIFGAEPEWWCDECAPAADPPGWEA